MGSGVGGILATKDRPLGSPFRAGAAAERFPLPLPVAVIGAELERQGRALPRLPNASQYADLRQTSISDLVEGPGQKVGGAHPGLEGPERVFDGLSSHANGLGIACANFFAVLNSLRHTSCCAIGLYNHGRPEMCANVVGRNRTPKARRLKWLF